MDGCPDGIACFQPVHALQASLSDHPENFSEPTAFQSFQVLLKDSSIPCEVTPLSTACNWQLSTAVQPAQPGLHVFEDIELQELLPFIDWTPFFQTWELQGRYPQIFDDEDKGEAARNLFTDAQSMLSDIVAGEWLKARATVGIFKAVADGDDVLVDTEGAAAQKVTFT